MPSRIRTGTSVQTTSMKVLCVVFRRHRVGATVETDDHPEAGGQVRTIEMTSDDGQQDRVVDPFGILAIFAELFLKVDFLRLRHADAVGIVRTHRRIAGQRAIHRLRRSGGGGLSWRCSAATGAAAAGVANRGCSHFFDDWSRQRDSQVAPYANDGIVIAARTTRIFFNIFINLAPYSWCGAGSVRRPAPPRGNRTRATYRRAFPKPQAVDARFLAFICGAFPPICRCNPL